MVACLPRLAETRAKSRALRDAVNAGALVAVEELGDGDDSAEPTPRPTANATPATNATPAPPATTSSPSSPADDPPASAAQLNAVRALAKQRGVDPVRAGV